MDSLAIDSLPIPVRCDICQSIQIRWYKGTNGKNAYWECRECKAAISCVVDSQIPMGFMALKSTRKRRVKLHDVFDKIWQFKLMERAEAYKWLAQQLSIPQGDCHISRLNDNQLEAAIPICQRYVANWRTITNKRLRKKDEKLTERLQRDRNKANARKSKR